MTRNLQPIHISLLFLIMAFSSMALTPPGRVFLSPTETPNTISPTPIATNTIKPKLTSTATRPVRRPRLTVTAADVPPTPIKSRPTPIPLDVQAGHSDWIVAIGILIVAIIVIPIMLKRNEWG